MDAVVIVGALIVLVAIIWAIAKAAGGGRYTNMTEEQFEAEAKRSSALGTAVTGLQKIIDPGHRVEYVQEEKVRPEADEAESGDLPAPGHSPVPKR